MINIKKIKKQTYVRSNCISIFKKKGTTITWIESSGIEIDKNYHKTILFDEIFKGFTKDQKPIFNYKMKEDKVLIIRSHLRDYIYIPSDKEDDVSNEIFRHPQDLKKIFK